MVSDNSHYHVKPPLPRDMGQANQLSTLTTSGFKPGPARKHKAPVFRVCDKKIFCIMDWLRAVMDKGRSKRAMAIRTSIFAPSDAFP